MASLIASASSAVHFGREIAATAAQSAQSPPPYSNQPYTSPASPTVVQQLQHPNQQCDANNNSIEQPSEPPLYENGSSQLPSPPILAPYSPGGNSPSSSSLSTSVFRPTAVLPVQSGQQQQTPTPDGDGSAQSERVSVEQQEECKSVQQEGEEEEEAKMRQMISRIESELSEMRLKEQQQSFLSQPQSSSGASGLNHSAGSAPEQERILDGAAAACTRTENQSEDCRDSSSGSCTAVGSAFRRVQAPKPPSQPQSNHNHQPSLYSQESPPLAPSQPEEAVPLEEMQAYQQRPASSSSYNHQQQSAILETLFNDMQGRQQDNGLMRSQSLPQQQQTPLNCHF